MISRAPRGMVVLLEPGVGTRVAEGAARCRCSPRGGAPLGAAQLPRGPGPGPVLGVGAGVVSGSVSGGPVAAVARSTWPTWMGSGGPVDDEVPTTGPALDGQLQRCPEDVAVTGRRGPSSRPQPSRATSGTSPRNAALARARSAATAMTPRCRRRGARPRRGRARPGSRPRPRRRRRGCRGPGHHVAPPRDRRRRAGSAGDGPGTAPRQPGGASRADGQDGAAAGEQGLAEGDQRRRPPGPAGSRYEQSAAGGDRDRQSSRVVPADADDEMVTGSGQRLGDRRGRGARSSAMAWWPPQVGPEASGARGPAAVRLRDPRRPGPCRQRPNPSRVGPAGPRDRSARRWRVPGVGLLARASAPRRPG